MAVNAILTVQWQSYLSSKKGNFFLDNAKNISALKITTSTISTRVITAWWTQLIALMSILYFCRCLVHLFGTAFIKQNRTAKWWGTDNTFEWLTGLWRPSDSRYSKLPPPSTRHGILRDRWSGGTGRDSGHPLLLGAGNCS